MPDREAKVRGSILMAVMACAGMLAIIPHAISPAFAVAQIGSVFAISFALTSVLTALGLYKTRFWRIAYFSVSSILAGAFGGLMDLMVVTAVTGMGLNGLAVIDGCYLIVLAAVMSALNIRFNEHASPPSIEMMRAFGFLRRLVLP
jgi:hypothetical protein